MKTLHLLFSSLLSIFSPCVICAWQTRDSLVLTQSETLRYATLVNDYFMRTYPDVGAKSYVGNKERTSKIWTRSVYYEGLMSLYRQHQDERWLKYTEDWGNHHGWKASEKKQERHADFQCCGQAYLDMYMLNPAQTVRKTHIKKLIDDMLATNVVDDWYWVDAVQMAMPIFAQLGTIEKLPCVIRGWNAMCKVAVHDDGFLGYVQGAGAKPEDGQPVLFDRAADFEDFGIGCYLLAAAEVYQLGDVDLREPITGMDILPEKSDNLDFSWTLSGDKLKIGVLLDTPVPVTVRLYDISGNLVKALSVQKTKTGKNEFIISLFKESICYICTVETAFAIKSKKIVIVR